MAKPSRKYAAVSRCAFSRAACLGIAPDDVISAAYAATCRGSQASNSSRVIGRNRGVSSVTNPI